MTGLQFAELFESIAPVDSGVPGDELGFVFGNPEVEIRGIGCVWSVQASSIAACAEKGINLIVTHERLWLPKQESNWYECPPEHELHAQLQMGRCPHGTLHPKHWPGDSPVRWSPHQVHSPPERR